MYDYKERVAVLLDEKWKLTQEIRSVKHFLVLNKLSLKYHRINIGNVTYEKGYPVESYRFERHSDKNDLLSEILKEEKLIQKLIKENK